MNSARTLFKKICATALIALVAACATSHPDRDRTAIAAGFKIATPTTPEQKALYAKLPKDTVQPVRYKGVIYYVMRDSTNGMALVGNSAQYQVYQEMRYRQSISKEDMREAVQTEDMNNANWGAWEGGGVAFGFFP